MSPTTGARPGVPRLIACEGIDGSGKSTIAREIVAALARRGEKARLTQEPTSTWLGQAVRRALAEDLPPFTDALLFMADHAAHVAEVERWLASGETVVTDRWADSTLAYQGASLAERLARVGVADPVRWLLEVEKPFHREADIVLLFDLPVDVALARLAKRESLDKFERREFLERVRANYLRLAKERSHWRILDAERPPPDVLAEALRALE